ncbi:MAG: hypothetical protein ABI995_16090 [Acidobacteriota bacterium]
MGGKFDDAAYPLKVDAQGSAYLAGVASTEGFPLVGNGLTKGRAFVSRLSPDGSHVIFSSLLNG